MLPPAHVLCVLPLAPSVSPQAPIASPCPTAQGLRRATTLPSRVRSGPSGDIGMTARNEAPSLSPSFPTSTAYRVGITRVGEVLLDMGGHSGDYITATERIRADRGQPSCSNPSPS